MPTAPLARLARKLSRNWQRATGRNQQQSSWHLLSLMADELARRADSPLPVFYARLLAAREARALGREYAAQRIHLTPEQAYDMGWLMGDQRIRAGYHTALDAPTYRAFFAEQFTRGYAAQQGR
jgi:hypothetical protein